MGNEQSYVIDQCNLPGIDNPDLSYAEKIVLIEKYIQSSINDPVVLHDESKRKSLSNLIEVLQKDMPWSPFGLSKTLRLAKQILEKKDKDIQLYTLQKHLTIY